MECTNRALPAPRICRSASTTAWFSRGRTSLAEDGALPVLRCTGILDVRLSSLRVLRLARCTSHDRSVGRVAAAFARVTVHLSCLFSTMENGTSGIHGMADELGPPMADVTS